MSNGNDPTEPCEFAIAEQPWSETVVGETGTPAPNNRGSNWANWIGAVFYGTFAIWIFAGASQFSVLLLPSIFHEVLVAVCFLIRSAPQRRFNVWYARASAYIATFAFPVFTSFAGSWHRAWLAPSTNASLVSVGMALWFLGTLFGFWPLWFLRRSFSLEPQARELVTDGPYRMTRHP